MTHRGRLNCKFAIGQSGLAHSGVWQVRSKKSDLYCFVSAIGGEIKASIHGPRPPEYPGWKRHLGHPKEASGEVAVAAKKDSGPHITSWPGKQLAIGATLEWRIVFPGTSLRSNPLQIDSEITLLPIPKLTEQVEVGVIMGPPELAGRNPRGYPVAWGSLDNGYLVWIVFVIKQIAGPAQVHGPVVLPSPVKRFESSNIDRTHEFRACLTGVQTDGHLAFWDVRATLS